MPMSRVRSWWQQRKRRRLLHRLARAIEEEAVTVADHSSAALLATLTECLARMTSARASPKQISAALALARRTYDDYRVSVERCRTLRDEARAEAAKWRHNVARAVDAGAPEL